ncbi:hypothetical protein D3C85_1072340 [compost metagenome]
MHQHLQPAQRGRRRLGGEEGQRAGHGAQALGEDLVCPGFQGRQAVPGRSRPAVGAGTARLRHRRLRLHHLQRHVWRAGPGDPAGNHRPRPVRHRGTVRQPQLRRPYPSLRQAGLPGLAAAGGGLRHRRYRALRHRAGRIGYRPGRQPHHPEGPVAERRGDRRDCRSQREAGTVQADLHPDVRSGHYPGSRKPAVRLASDVHLHPSSAVLGRRPGRRAHPQGHAPAGDPAGQHHHRPPVAVQRDPDELGRR